MRSGAGLVHRFELFLADTDRRQTAQTSLLPDIADLLRGRSFLRRFRLESWHSLSGLFTLVHCKSDLTSLGALSVIELLAASELRVAIEKI